MKILGAFTAVVLLAGSASASSISFGGSSKSSSPQSLTLKSQNSDGNGNNGNGIGWGWGNNGDNGNNKYSSWSEMRSRGGEGSDGAYLADSISTAYGLDVGFQYSMGDGEDGFSFLVLDSDRSDKSGRQESILNIEFNRLITGKGEGEGQYTTEDVISLRGPGDGSKNDKTENGFENYSLIATTAKVDGKSMRVDEGWASVEKKRNGDTQDTEVVVDTTQLADGRLPVTVWMTGGKGEKVVMAQYDAYKEVCDYYGGAENIPQSMRIGFSGSTGSGSTPTTTSSFALAGAPVTATPEPSTLMLGVGGALVAGVAAWRKRRN